MKAPETPPIDVHKDIPKATSGGIHGEISIWATGKYIPLIYPSLTQRLSVSIIFSACALLDMLNLDFGR